MADLWPWVIERDGEHRLPMVGVVTSLCRGRLFIDYVTRFCRLDI